MKKENLQSIGKKIGSNKRDSERRKEVGKSGSLEEGVNERWCGCEKNSIILRWVQSFYIYMKS